MAEKYLGESIKNLGFGLMRLPMLGDEIDIEQTKRMVDTFVAKGFTYFDTAYVYIGGKSEVALKEAVVDRYPRDSFQCATKLPFWDMKEPSEMETVFQTSLDRAGLEYYDFYLLHGLNAEVVKKVDAFGGWLDRQMIDHYLRYAEVCFNHFKGRVKRWVTVNEQLIATAAGIMNGNHETDPQKNLQNIYQMSYHVSLAEHRAMALLRQIDPDAQIGPVCAIQVVYPHSSRAEDVLAAENAEELMEFYLLDLSVRGEYPPYVASYLKAHGFYPETRPEDAAVLKASTPDFIGINYYFSICVKAKEGPVNYNQPPFWVSDAFDICDNPYLEKTEWMDKGIDPVGLRIGMRKVYNRYRLPMIVTENGMAYSETLGEDGCIHDPYRIDYLARHIEQLGEMIEEGLPVFGYCPWSFVDVVSSHQGFAKRYGLVYVDRTETDPKQCARVKKDSFYWYQKVIAQNGLSE